MKKDPHQRTAYVPFRLTQEEKDQLKKEADVAGIPVGELVRRRCFNRPVIAKVDLVMVEELRRQGGLLKSNFSTLRNAEVDKELVLLHEECLRGMISLIDKISIKFYVNEE